MIHQQAHTGYLTSSQATACLDGSAATLPRAVRCGAIIPAYRNPRDFVRDAPSASAADAQWLVPLSPPTSAVAMGKATR